jgi:hypothetical protein
MVETPNRQLGPEQAATGTPSTTEVKAVIRETRARLAARLTDTADRVDAIFARPTVAQAQPRDGGLVGAAISTIAAVGRTRRAWSQARSTGLFRRAAVAIVAAGIAGALAAKARRA